MKRFALLAVLALTLLAGASVPKAEAGICTNDVSCLQKAQCDFICGGPGHGGCLGSSTCCVCH